MLVNPKMSTEAVAVAPREEIQEEAVAEENRQATNELLANATLQNRPEALREVTGGVITNEDASSIGKELEETADPITEELYSGSSETLSKESETTIFEAINELLNVLYPASDKQEETLSSTQQLDQAFDDAIDRLIKAPIADQTHSQRFITFLKCITFAIRLVKRYKERNESDERIVWVVRNVGRLLIRAAIRHKLYEYISGSGGWRGLYTTVHEYIRGLRTRIRSSTDSREGSTFQLPIGTIITVAIIGTAVVAVGGYTYIRFRN